MKGNITQVEFAEGFSTATISAKTNGAEIELMPPYLGRSYQQPKDRAVW